MRTRGRNKIVTLDPAHALDAPADRADFAQRYLAQLAGVLTSIPQQDVAKVIRMLEQAYVQGRTVFLAGNGGSAATAMHLANDLVAGVAKHAAHGFKAVCLCSNVPIMTCIANDNGYDEIFSRQLRELARPGDLLLAFSGSGNSPNILAGLETARELDMTRISFLARDGGKAAALSSYTVIVPAEDYGVIEDAHMALSHLVVSYLKQWAADTRPRRS